MRFQDIVFTVFILWTLGLQAQDLESLRWQHRVILLYTNSLENQEYKAMTSRLRADPSGAEARKIVIYTLMGGQISRGLPAKDWAKPDTWKGKDIDLQESFRMELLGLDGGVKYSSDTAIDLEGLWALIDGMPMRRSELRTKGIP